MVLKLSKEDAGAKIRNTLVGPKVALSLLAKHYRGKKVPKDFIEMAIEDINKVAQLSDLFRSAQSDIQATKKDCSSENKSNIRKGVRKQEIMCRKF